MCNREVAFTKKALRRIFPVIMCVVLIASLAACEHKVEKVKEDIMEENKTQEGEPLGNEKEEGVNAKVKIQIGDTLLTATLESNRSADAFKELLKEGGLTIDFSQYGGFEQVGSIGTELPRDDVKTTTSPGDIVLYQGNQLVMFYGSNSWEYTRIGKIDNAWDLKSILGGHDITATFTLAE